MLLLVFKADWQNDSPPSPEWPREAQIEIQNLAARYKKDLPLVLNNVSVIIKPGEKASWLKKMYSILPYLND